MSVGVGERAGRDDGGKLVGHPRGRTMLPGGTPRQLVRLLVFAGERVAIWAGRAALDVALVFSGAAGGQIPRAVIGHRTFDAEQASVEIGDDQEEDGAGVGGRSWPLLHSTNLAYDNGRYRIPCASND